MAFLFSRQWREQRKASQSATWASHNASVEANITSHINAQAQAFAQSLVERRGGKLRKDLFPDANALAAEIAQNRLAEFRQRGEYLMKKVNAVKKGNADFHGFSALSLGFASYASSQAFKGPLAMQHRLGGFHELIDKVYGGTAGAKKDSHRLGKVYAQMGIWRAFTKYTWAPSSVPLLSWHAGRVWGWAGLPFHWMGKAFNLLGKVPFLSPVILIGKKVATHMPLVSNVTGAVEKHLLKKDMGAWSRYAIRWKWRRPKGAPITRQQVAAAPASAGQAHGEEHAHAEQPGHGEEHAGHGEGHGEAGHAEGHGDAHGNGHAENAGHGEEHAAGHGGH